MDSASGRERDGQLIMSRLFMSTSQRSIIKTHAYRPLCSVSAKVPTVTQAEDSEVAHRISETLCYCLVSRCIRLFCGKASDNEQR